MSRRQVLPTVRSIDIAAPIETVWALLYDQRHMARWSPETWRQLFMAMPLRRGTLSFNLNKRKAIVWPTVSRYVAVEPRRRIAFRVFGPAATWSFDLEPVPTGTRVTQTRVLKNNRASWVTYAVAGALLGGVRQHDDELAAGMDTTLARLRAEAEA